MSVINGDFETGINPPGDSNVDLWFDANTVAGATDWWTTTQHEQGLSPTADTGVLLGDGNGTVGGPLGVGGRWLYQQIGTKSAGDSYSISFDYGPDLNAAPNRAVAIRVEVFQGAFLGAADDNDIVDEGLTLVTTLNSPTTSAFGEGTFASFTSSLNLSTANTTDPLWLRLSNLPGAGSDPGSWVVIDNVAVQGSGTGTLAGETITIQGDLNLQTGATTKIDLAAGAHDRVVVAGSASLAGLLDIAVLPTFTPILGQSLEIMDVGGSLTGFFTGLPQGALIGDFGATDLFLTYTGGDGNDVALIATVAGDFDLDFDVDGRDFLAWQRNPNLGSLADWQANYGTPSLLAASVTIPEPSGLGLLCISAIFRKRVRTRVCRHC